MRQALRKTDQPAQSWKSGEQTQPSIQACITSRSWVGTNNHGNPESTEFSGIRSPVVRASEH